MTYIDQPRRTRDLQLADGTWLVDHVKSEPLGGFERSDGVHVNIVRVYFNRDDIKQYDVDGADKMRALRSAVNFMFIPTYCQQSYDCCGGWYRNYSPEILYNSTYHEAIVTDTLYQNI